MLQRISAPISVDFFFDHTLRRAAPRSILWEGRQYQVLRVGMHHTYRFGRTLFHVFSVETAALFFRLVFDSESLQWRVEEISDGESD